MKTVAIRPAWMGSLPSRLQPAAALLRRWSPSFRRFRRVARRSRPAIRSSMFRGLRFPGGLARSGSAPGPHVLRRSGRAGARRCGRRGRDCASPDLMLRPELRPASRITFSMARSMRSAEPASRVPPTQPDAAIGMSSTSTSPSLYRPGRQPAGMTASVIRMERSSPLARSAALRNDWREMNAVHDETRGQAIVGQLLPDVVGMARQHA